MNERIRKLMNNSIIFALGNFGSRMISIIMVPFYTFILSTQQYGRVDIYLTAISLLIPIATLSIPDAVLRFIMDGDEDEEEVIQNSFFLMLFGMSVTLILMKIISYFFYFPDSLLFIIVLQSIQMFLMQYIRAIGRVKEYAVNGVLTAIILSLSNILFMYIFKLGVDGYLYSIILTNMASIVYLSRFIKLRLIYKNKKISSKASKDILIYSLPLIPNAIMWWTLNASSRFLILYFLGLSFNGIFAVSNKIPTLLTVFQTIFFQAWQLSAIEESHSVDSHAYNAQVYSFFSQFMFMATLVLIPLSKFIVIFFLDKSFSDAWKFIPFLLLGVLYSSFSSFLGTHYLVLKKTSAIFFSTILGAIVNVISCYVLINLIGLQGASISMFLGFFIMYLYRLRDINKISMFIVDKKNEIYNLMILLVATQIIMIRNLYINTICFGVIFIVSMGINKKFIFTLCKATGKIINKFRLAKKNKKK